MLSAEIFADVAQLAEQLICNQQVIGSSPIIGLYETLGEVYSGLCDITHVILDL
jgi:hypothetical protein